MRSRADVIKPMLSLVNQLAIKPLETESIAEVFFRSIRKTDIYPVPTFVKADSTTRLSFDDYDELLPLSSLFPTPKSVIIMNNASVHCNSRIEELITSHGPSIGARGEAGCNCSD